MNYDDALPEWAEKLDEMGFDLLLWEDTGKQLALYPEDLEAKKIFDEQQKILEGSLE